MIGNFQVRFLEGGGLATARFHSAKGRSGVMEKNRSQGLTQISPIDLPEAGTPVDGVIGVSVLVIS